MLLRHQRSAVLVIILVIAGALIAVATHAAAASYLSTHSGSGAAVQCTGTHTVHRVVIQDDQMRPALTKATLCDRITITNADTVYREIAFGKHDHHVAYDGVTEKPLAKGQSLNIELNQTGTYLFHDHLHDEVKGDFTVTP